MYASFVLVIIGFFLFLWFQGVLYRKLWSKKLTVDLKFSRSTAFAGDSLYLLETISNAKFLPINWLKIKFRMSKNIEFTDQESGRVLDDYYRDDLFSLMMYQRVIRKLSIICKKRGYYTIDQIDYVSGNLLMTEKLVSSAVNNTVLTVYPKPVNIEEEEIPYKQLFGTILTRRYINPDPFEFKGIREYQPYDEFKNINFTATAKANKLMVNVHDYTINQELTIILNIQVYGPWISLDLFESAISLAAALSEYFLGSGIPVRFVTNAKDILNKERTDTKMGVGSIHLNEIFEALAKIDLTQNAEPVTNIVDEILADKKNEQIYVLISTCDDREISEAFDNLREAALQALWILPVYNHMTVKAILSDEVIRWEVENNRY